jgi:hypothetical protein
MDDISKKKKDSMPPLFNLHSRQKEKLSYKKALAKYVLENRICG